MRLPPRASPRQQLLRPAALLSLLLLLLLPSLLNSNSSDSQQQERQHHHQLVERTRVVIVGSGPAALAASALLSGHWPYYSQPHPNGKLHAAVSDALERHSRATGRPVETISLLELDLGSALRAALSLPGARSNNPCVRWRVAVCSCCCWHPDVRRVLADGRC